MNIPIALFWGLLITGIDSEVALSLIVNGDRVEAPAAPDGVSDEFGGTLFYVS